MKSRVSIVALGILSLISFNTSATESSKALAPTFAFLSTDTQATGRQTMGTISIIGINGSPSDVSEALASRTEKQDAGHFRFIEAHVSNNWHATAELYR